MTDEEVKNLVASIAIAQAKTDEQINDLKIAQAKTDEIIKQNSEEIREFQAKTDEQINQTHIEMRKLRKQVGGISRSMGDITEEFFINSLTPKMELAGILYNFAEKNHHRVLGNIQEEYDILMVNGQEVAIIEVK